MPITPNSPYDKFVKGNKTALTKQQQRGMEKFASIGCVSCHSGPAFNGPQTNTGEGFYAKFPTFTNNPYPKKYDLMKDKGRAEVTGKETDTNQFRVQTLRNITETAPYFHNGSVNNLHEAVRIMAKTQLDNNLNAKDTNDIVSFLESLTGEYPVIVMPRLPATSGSSILIE